MVMDPCEDQSHYIVLTSLLMTMCMIELIFCTCSVILCTVYLSVKITEVVIVCSTI